MTVVTLEALETALGGPVAVSAGVVTAQYWAGTQPVTEIDGERVIFPREMRSEIVDGRPTTVLDLIPTRGVRCVRWDIKTARGTWVKIYTEIPDVESIGIGDLVQVDPKTFEPTGEVVAAWEAVVAVVQADRERAEEAAGEAVASAAAAGASAVSAEGDASSAAGSATTAVAARDEAVAAADAAESAATRAEQIGTPVVDEGGKLLESVLPDPLTPAGLSATISESVDPVRPGVQRAGYRLNGAGSKSNSPVNNLTANLHARIPFRLPVAARRIRLHFWNRDVSGGGAAPTPGALDVVGAYVGLSALDATGSPTNRFDGEPVQLSGPFATDATGETESVTPWLDIDISPARDYLLSFGVRSIPPTQVAQRGRARMWWTTTITDVAQMTPNNMVLTDAWFDTWIEYEYESGQAHGLFLGDSLTVGYGTTWPHRDSYPSYVAGAQCIGESVGAWHGSSMVGDWANPSYAKWLMVGAVSRPAFVDIGLGSNDVGGGAARTLAQMQSDLGAVISNVRAIHGDVPIYVRTIMPRSLTGQQETDRVAFNTWLKVSQPWGIAGVFDIAAPVTDPSDASKILPAYTIDTVHLNALGYRLIATRCVPPSPYTTASSLG